MQKESSQKKNHHLKGLLIRLGIIGASIFILLFFILGIHIYHGNYMAPWMKDGDLVFILKTASNYADRVVAYKANGETRFGRVVGLSGDVINITQDTYTINGSIPVEKVYYDTRGEITETVPEGCVFVLNDNREDTSMNNSGNGYDGAIAQYNDSRTFGSIPIKNIEGVVVFEMSRRGFWWIIV